jgi:hypothetical protein
MFPVGAVTEAVISSENGVTAWEIAGIVPVAADSFAMSVGELANKLAMYAREPVNLRF